MKFRKKPVVIEAVKWTGANVEDLELFGVPLSQGRASGEIGICTLEGCMFASPQDWIICGIKGEFYPCKPDIFEATYEAVTPQ